MLLARSNQFTPWTETQPKGTSCVEYRRRYGSMAGACGVGSGLLPYAGNKIFLRQDKKKYIL